MSRSHSRRGFLADVARGNLQGILGPSLLTDLGLAPKALAEDLNSPLFFGGLEPLVCALQESPVEQLQVSSSKKRIQAGSSLKTLVAAATLSNSRTSAGEDYIGFHKFMALGSALKMSALMPKGSAALPVFTVRYRNSSRILEFGGRESEVLHGLSTPSPANEANAAASSSCNQSEGR